MSAWRLHGQRFGIGRYIEYILKNWALTLGPEDHVTVFTRDERDTEMLSLPETFTTTALRPAMKNALWENLLLPRAAAASHVDVLFGPSSTLPLLSGGRSVVAIHSADEARGMRRLWHRMTYSQKYKWSARRSNRVIVNSRFISGRVQAVYGIPAEKIRVIWLGADDVFHPIDDQALLRATRIQWLGADRPYILFSGGLSRHRNVPMLIEAFGMLKKRDNIPHALLLFGANRGNVPFREIAGRCGVADSVFQTDGAVKEHHELAAVYNAAAVYVLPSASDGFSLTLAEALSCGTPVVTVNKAALGEVAHGYAMTIEEPEVGALAEAIHRVLIEPGLAPTLRAKGLERARELRWDRTAQRTLDVLREVAAE